jgi:predicted hydrocarbon binding protein
MATQIVAVNTVSVPNSTGTGKHKHIYKIKTTGGRVLTRADVVSRIQNGQEEFVTVANGKEAKVIVVDCPSCAAGDYIKTTADDTTADNLLDLPSFT